MGGIDGHMIGIDSYMISIVGHMIGIDGHIIGIDGHMIGIDGQYRYMMSIDDFNLIYIDVCTMTKVRSISL